LAVRQSEERGGLSSQKGDLEGFLYGAALFACPIGVVLQAVQQVAQLHPGETVLVTGAGGGLGVHAVQLAVHLGARVLAATSSPEKVPQLVQLGATEVLEIPRLTYDFAASSPSRMEKEQGDEALDFSELAVALTGDRGVDMVIDTVGSALFPSTWRSLAQYGRLLLLGEVTGRSVKLDLAEVIFRDARILGSSGVSRYWLQQTSYLVGQGHLKPVVSRVLSLEEAGLAFDLLTNRKVLGRVVLVPFAV
jgi:NADPH:quinone reductase-like Zn-dependent oxidoreductase